jgi:hypothetical protein
MVPAALNAHALFDPALICVHCPETGAFVTTPLASSPQQVMLKSPWIAQLVSYPALTAIQPTEVGASEIAPPPSEPQQVIAPSLSRAQEWK